MFRLTSIISPNLSTSLRTSNIRKLHQNPRLLRGAASPDGCISTAAEASPTQKQWKEVQIPVPWGHISGKWWGSTDKQPLLALHGWQDNANTFDFIAPLLAVDSFLAIDMPGHGRSSHYPVGQCYHYIDEVINLRRIVRHYGWDKVSIIGHSIGSSMGFVYSAYFPDDVDKFISIDCIRGAIRQDHKQLVQTVCTALESNLRIEQKLGHDPPSYKYEDIVDLYVQASHGSLTRESCKKILARGLTKLDENRYYLSRDPRLKMHVIGFFDEEFLKALAAQITCEVLSIRATQGFSVGGNRGRVYMETLDLVEKSARRFTHVDLEGTHHIHLNNPKTVAEHINDFLAPKSPATTKIY